MRRWKEHRKSQKEGKKERRSSFKSSRSLTEYQPPMSDCCRDSPELQSPSAAAAPYAEKGSSETEYGELFHDAYDPQTVTTAVVHVLNTQSGDVRKKLSLDEQNSQVKKTLTSKRELPEAQMQLSESTLSNTSVESQAVAETHAEQEARLRSQQPDLVNQLREEINQLKGDKAMMETLEKQYEDEQSKLKTQHADEVGQLKEKILQLQNERKEEKDSLQKALSEAADKHRRELGNLEKKNTEPEHVNNKCMKLEREKKKLEESRKEMEEKYRHLNKQLEAGVAEQKRIEEQKRESRAEVIQLQQKCTEQNQKIRDLTAGAAVDSTAKLQGLERTVKSYESKVLELEQRLLEEQKLRLETEENLKLMSEVPGERHKKDDDIANELRQKEEELSEVKHHLERIEEQLQEQETKREECQRSLDTLQKSYKKLESSTKSSAELEDYFDLVTKNSELLSIVEKQLEEEKKKTTELKKVVDNADRIEPVYVQTTESLSKAEAEIKQLQAQIARLQQVQDETIVHVEDKENTGLSRSEAGKASKDAGKMKQQIHDLKEKLAARDDELSELKTKQGNSPLSNPPTTPTESMKESSEEVTTLKLKLKEKRQEIQNMRAQVGSMQGILQQKEALKKESDDLKLETMKLSEHIKKQSHEVLKLKGELETSNTIGTSDMSNPQMHQLQEEVERWKSMAESTSQEVKELEAKVVALNKERNEWAFKNAAAIEKANEETQHMRKDVAILEEKAEQMRSECAHYREEIVTLNQKVTELKQNELTTERERNALTTHEIQKELERLREESHEKDLILQKSAEEESEMTAHVKELEERLATADIRYKELTECNEDLIRNQHQIVQDELQHKTREVAELQQDLQAKIAQVKQYKKQLQEKTDLLHERQKPQESTQEVEDLQLELAKSRSTLEEIQKMLIDTQKSFKDLSHKNSEMEAQYSKRVEEKDCELKQLLGKNQAMLAKVHELETLQQLMKKEAELQLVKARQQQTGMATKLSRLQKDRRREDEFSKAFQQEFDANKVLRAKCSYLQKQLDSALDAVDALNQQQEVLKLTLHEHGMQFPFVESKPNRVEQSNIEEVPHQQGHAPVAISQKPIASPGLYNQQADDIRYMPPHSNAELQYKEQLAEKQRIAWHQQQLGHVQQVPNITTRVQAVPHVQQQHRAAEQTTMYEAEPVVGILPSAIGHAIVPRSQQPHTSQWPLQSRYSDGEIQQALGPQHTDVCQSQMQTHIPQSVESVQQQFLYGHVQSADEQQNLSQPPSEASTYDAGVTGQAISGYLQQNEQTRQPPAASHIQPLPPPPEQLQAITYAAQYPTNPPLVKAVPESTGCIPQQTPSEQNTDIVCKNSEPNGDEVLMRNLRDDIQDTAAGVEESDRVGDTGLLASGLPSLPQDPNLVCVVCSKVYKIGQIQHFKRHVKSCTGSKQ